jgi:hypothetical protein
MEATIREREQARTRWRQARVAAAGALPLLTGVLLWAWLLAGVVSPLGAMVRSFDDARRTTPLPAARPTVPDALACACPPGEADRPPSRPAALAPRPYR